MDKETNDLKKEIKSLEDEVKRLGNIIHDERNESSLVHMEKNNLINRIEGEKKICKRYVTLSQHHDNLVLYGHVLEVLERLTSTDDISFCNQCHSMTKTIDGKCGKCKKAKGKIDSGRG